VKLTPEQIRYFREDAGAASKYLFGSEPLWYQEDMLSVANNARIAMWLCSRGTAKTWEGAIWLCQGASLYNDMQCCVYAKDYNYTKATFDKLEKIYNISPFLKSITYGPPKISKNKSEFKFRNGSLIYAEPFKRGRRWNRILLDEAREIDLSDFSTIILPMLSDPHPVAPNRLLMASSKTYAGEPLHKLYLEFIEYIKKGDTDYGIAEYDIYDAKDSPYYDHVMIANAKKIMLEEEFQIEFENIWVNLAGGWIKGPLIRNSELEYKPELFGEIGYQYVIGLDYGRAANGDATSATITKIVPNEGVRFSKNKAVTGMSIPDQSLLIKQLWKDFGGKNRGEVVALPMDNEKLGMAVADLLKLPSVDPRDGGLLPPIVPVDDYETPDAIRIIIPINFRDTTNIWNMATNMKKGLELGTLHFPKDAYKISMSPKEKESLDNNDREFFELYEEISELKREMCNVEVQANANCSILTFKRNSNRKDKKDRFTSAFLSASEALNRYDELSENNNGSFVGCIG
jgi:hypothetical protein